MLKRTSINFVNDTLNKNSNWKVLDIGCGYRANKYATVIADVKDFSNFYKNKKFVKIAKLDSFLSTNDVIHTNNCIISVCKSKYKDKIIILSAIDNLIKGGGGQAVQNMNIYYDFKENEGLNE